MGATLLLLGGRLSFVGSMLSLWVVDSFVGGGFVCGQCRSLVGGGDVRGWGADVCGRGVVVQAWPPFHCVVIRLCRSCGCCEQGMKNRQVLTRTT